jgi:shikimate dehydrogenase
MAERISGHTELIGLMATPIRHSLSPTMHNESFAKLGLDYAYLAFEVGNEQLENAVKAIRALGMRGSNVSMPNKQVVLKYLDKLSPAAEMVGAVNTIVNDKGVLTGHITDGTGFMLGLKQAEVDVIGKKITLCGAGGAATAICIQAALDGVKELAIFNLKDDFYKNSERTVAIINEKTDCKATLYDLADEESLRREILDSAVFINATGVGMKPLQNESLITDATMLRPDLIVADTVYVPSETVLLKLAKEQGCKTVNGLGMMLWQGAAAFEIWTGQEMPVDYIKELLFK